MAKKKTKVVTKNPESTKSPVSQQEPKQLPTEYTQGGTHKQKNKSTLIIIIVVVVVILLCVATVIGGAVAFFVINKNQSSLGESFDEQTTDYPSAWEETATCEFPTVNYPESAFSIGVPDGWIHEVDSGTIAIMEDESNTNAAFIYTARLEQDLSASEFLRQFAEVFDTIITDAGGDFSIGDIKTDETDGMSTATSPAQANVEEGSLTGAFKVEKDSAFVTLKVFWAPVEKFETNKEELQAVVDCFHRDQLLTDDILSAAEDASTTGTGQAATTFSPYNGQYFNLELPNDYTVTGETDSGIDISRNDNSVGFSYAYLTGAQGPYTPQTWIENAFPTYLGLSNLQLSNAANIPSEISGYTIQEYEFSGILNGTRSVKGKTTVGVYNTPNYGFGQSSSVFWAVQLADPEVWSEVAEELQILQNSVEVTDIGSRKNVILPPNRPIDTVGGDSITSGYEYRSAVSDRAAQNWSDAMRGYEPVESPSTGQMYDAPLNSWNANGPDGPGYYRELPGGGVEKLQENE